MFPKRGAIAVITTFLALILLFNFKTPDQAAVGTITSIIGSAVAASPSSGASTNGGANTNGGASASNGTGATTPTAPPTAGTATTQTVTGSTVATRYGDVEVQITVAGGTITAIEAVALPSGGRSGQISRSVAPILASEVLTTQSAKIDIVSGATYTSEAYAQSLQAALDQVGLASAGTTG